MGTGGSRRQPEYISEGDFVLSRYGQLWGCYCDCPQRPSVEAGGCIGRKRGPVNLDPSECTLVHCALCIGTLLDFQSHKLSRPAVTSPPLEQATRDRPFLLSPFSGTLSAKHVQHRKKSRWPQGKGLPTKQYPLEPRPWSWGFLCPKQNWTCLPHPYWGVYGSWEGGRPRSW